jgi:(2Fe-2S) ferredoxin
VNPPRWQIVVCRGPECGERRNSAALHAELARLVRARGLEARVELDWQSCFGRCQSGPNILVRSCEAGAAPPPQFAVLLPSAAGDAVLYNGVSTDELARILTDHIGAGRPIRFMINRKPKGVATR